MKDTEYKVTTVEQKEPYIITCRCDRCKKVIYKKYGKAFENNNSFREYTQKVYWYLVTTGHNDWGNDSCDSYETKEICPKCLVNEYSDYVDRASRGWNTEYIEIEHNYCRSLPLDDKGEE